MVRSMTGYGRGEKSAEDCHIVVELKTLNHRSLDVVLRVPKEFFVFEDKIRRYCQENISRGRVEVYISREFVEQSAKKVVVDEELAASYFQALQKIKKLFALEDGLTAKDLADFPEVLHVEKKEVDNEKMWEVVEEALKSAIAQLITQREEEGTRLEADIGLKLGRINELAETLKERAPRIVEEYRQKLDTRLKELFGGNDYDEQRFFMEVSLYAEKCNIDEELVRLDSHIKTFNQDLNSDAVVGRKLDFILQEINREINTMSAKSNDAEISHLVVEIKSEVDKIREQVQNIE